jgi:hypothetical protein
VRPARWSRAPAAERSSIAEALRNDYPAKPSASPTGRSALLVSTRPPAAISSTPAELAATDAAACPLDPDITPSSVSGWTPAGSPPGLPAGAVRNDLAEVAACTSTPGHPDLSERASREALLPGEARSEDDLVARRDQLEVADREAGPAEDVERPHERGQRNPHLELVAVDRRQVDTEHRCDVEVDGRPVRAPVANGVSRPRDRRGLDGLRVVELRAHVLAVLGLALGEGRPVRLGSLVEEQGPGVLGRLRYLCSNHARAELLEPLDVLLGCAVLRQRAPPTDGGFVNSRR